MKKALSLERMTHELIAAKTEYYSFKKHFTDLDKPTKWDQTCRNRERDRYRRALIQGIKCLSNELLVTINEDMPPAEIVSTASVIEQDIADGKSFDL